MYTLGIETSCDETSAAVVLDGKKLLSNEVASSLAAHQKFGGIVPEIAFRRQLETISEVSCSALSRARVSLRRIGLISVTSGPGLLGSLCVGVSFAKSLSLALGCPLIGVNHIHSHIYAAVLSNKDIRLPFVSLVVSGGHTSLFYVRDFDRIELLGHTQDDACGESFDKVAKILGLGYPGGPAIEKVALRGDGKRYRFRCSGTKSPLNFSFSGIKTAVLYKVAGRRLKPLEKYDIAASFQRSVIDALIEKSLTACRMKKASSLVIGGGVVANMELRRSFSRVFARQGLSCYFPRKDLSTDNAAMVAGLGSVLYKKGHVSGLDLVPTTA